MIRFIKRVKRLIAAIHETVFYGNFSSRSYSQEGEDLILKRIFSTNSTGFFVDVGAHHPIRFSNTYYFYKKGWQGVNIEPNPDSLSFFKKYRPKDINVNCGIAKTRGVLSYFMFNEPALNTFDPEVCNSRITDTPFQHIKTIDINVAPLSEVLAKYCPKDRKIDFLTVDVEGLDFEVLKSNDWETYRPSWVLVEQLNLANVESLNFEIHVYMKSLNYELFAKTFNTLFYKDKAVSL